MGWGRRKRALCYRLVVDASRSDFLVALVHTTVPSSRAQASLSPTRAPTTTTATSPPLADCASVQIRPLSCVQTITSASAKVAVTPIIAKVYASMLRIKSHSSPSLPREGDTVPAVTRSQRPDLPTLSE